MAKTRGPAVYRNPFRHARVTPERIDQGVDYSGTGPIYALGPGRILMTKNSGWPGGAFIAELLTAGPAKGRIVYFAENIQPTVTVGEHVTADTRIGYFTPGGIEAGWAAPEPNLGETLARLHGQFTGANSTAYGAAFNRLMVALGAPSGILQTKPTGSAPGWASGGPGGSTASSGATLLSSAGSAGQGCITVLLLWPVLIPLGLARKLFTR